MIEYLPISLVGLTLREIRTLENNVFNTFFQMNLITDSYWFLLSRGLWETPDIKVYNTTTLNGLSYPSEYSFNEARQNIITIANDYANALNELKTKLPFYYRWIFPNKEKYIDSQEIIRFYEIRNIDQPMQERQQILTERTNIPENNYINALNEFWSLYRKQEQINLMIELYPPVLRPGGQITIIDPFKLSQEEETRLSRLTVIELGLRSDEYTTAIIQERDIYERGFVQFGRETRIPLEFSLFPLQPQPERLEAIELQTIIANDYPLLDARPLTEKELWNSQYAESFKEQDTIYRKAIEERNKLGCSNKPSDLNMIIWCNYYGELGKASEDNRNELLLNIKYPMDIEGSLTPLPEPPSPEPPARLSRKWEAFQEAMKYINEEIPFTVVPNFIINEQEYLDMGYGNGFYSTYTNYVGNWAGVAIIAYIELYGDFESGRLRFTYPLTEAQWNEKILRGQTLKQDRHKREGRI